MNKLKLDLDTIRVESFETSAESKQGGTVRGNDSGIDWGSTDWSADWNNTNSCPGTTCPGTGCGTLPADECPPSAA
jgi:hypothetical protein